ncbi:hypothetical protein ACFLSQ_04350, partial [Bacteroidota bacterium]
IISSTGSDYIDDAVILNASLVYKNFYGFDLGLIVKNVLDTEYYHTSNNTPQRYRQPQRAILFRIGYTIK